MNKSKIAVAATGGTTLIASLAAGFFLLKAFNAKTAALEGDMEEGIDGLGTVMQKATSLSRKPVYPCEKSVKEYEAKRDKFNEWRADALTIASRGDRNFTKTTSAAFKEFIFEESKRLVSLPGSVNGSLMKPDFPFGPFREFILDGIQRSATGSLAILHLDEMQAELAAHHIGDLARFQRKGGVGKGLNELVALHPAKFAAAARGLRTVVGVGNGGKALAAVQFLADRRHGRLGLFDFGLVGIGSQRHKDMRCLDFCKFFGICKSV